MDIFGEKTADSYKTTADLLIRKFGEREKVIESLFKAAILYDIENQEQAVECLIELHNILKGSTAEIEMDQYLKYLYQLGKLFEKHEQTIDSADVFAELAKEYSKIEEDGNESIDHLKQVKKFTAYLAKSLLLYDSAGKYDSILKLARKYYKLFPILQEHEHLRGELYFCYQHIINAADMTGSRYFREYYVDLNQKLKDLASY
jgi:hypothetical protein